jgi:hypothetical protein
MMQLQPHYVIASFARDPACRKAPRLSKFHARSLTRLNRAAFRDDARKDSQRTIFTAVRKA